MFALKFIFARVQWNIFVCFRMDDRLDWRNFNLHQSGKSPLIVCGNAVLHKQIQSYLARHYFW